MRFGKLLLILFGLLSCLYSIEAESQPSLDKVEQMVERGEYAAALAELDNLESRLSDNEQTVKWEISQNRIVSRLVEGNGYLFFLKQLNRYESAKPEWDFALAEVSVNHSRSDWESILFCIKMETGDTAWARKVNGLVDLGVDRQSGGLYLFRDKLISIATETGDILANYDLEKGVEGLVLGNQVVLTTRRGIIPIEPDTELLIHNPVYNQTSMTNVGDFYYVSPDGKYRLVEQENGLSFAPTSAVKETTPYVMRHVGLDPPLWMDEVPFFLTKLRGEPDAITWINPSYGHLMWKYQYGWGVYNHAWHSWSNGMRADIWFPVKAHGYYALMTIDQGGYLRFLNCLENTETAIKLADNYLCMPMVDGDQLIVASYDWIRSYKESHIHSPDSSVWANLNVMRAEIYFQKGELDSAEHILEEVTDYLPNRKDAWKLKAEISELKEDEGKLWLNYHKFMALDSTIQDDYAYQKWGLLRRFNLHGKPVMNTAAKDNHLYAATNGGGYWSVRLSDLYFGKVANMNRKLEYLKTESEIDFYTGSVPYQSDLSFPNAGFPRGNFDPEWFKQGGQELISQAYSYRGKSFRTTVNGGIRELGDSTFTYYPPLLGEIGSWKLLFTENEVFGYGQNVYQLDDHMRPAKVLIEIKIDGVRPDKVEIKSIRANDRSIGMVLYTSSGCYFQVYTHKGKLIQEVFLGKFLGRTFREDQLVELGNGYLYAGRQLHWLSDSENGEMWKYGPERSYTKGSRVNERWKYFGAPLAIQGMVFITGADGYLYVFDTHKITHPEKGKDYRIFD